MCIILNSFQMPQHKVNKRSGCILHSPPSVTARRWRSQQTLYGAKEFRFDNVLGWFHDKGCQSHVALVIQRFNTPDICNWHRYRFPPDPGDSLRFKGGSEMYMNRRCLAACCTSFTVSPPKQLESGSGRAHRRLVNFNHADCMIPKSLKSW